MNDFTKEELQSIWRWADAHSDKEWYKNLAQKIRPMIDTYCEHESDGKDYCPGLYDKVCTGNEITALDLTRVSKCLKCNRYFE